MQTGTQPPHPTLWPAANFGRSQSWRLPAASARPQVVARIPSAGRVTWASRSAWPSTRGSRAAVLPIVLALSLLPITTPTLAAAQRISHNGGEHMLFGADFTAQLLNFGLNGFNYDRPCSAESTRPRVAGGGAKIHLCHAVAAWCYGLALRNTATLRVIGPAKPVKLLWNSQPSRQVQPGRSRVALTDDTRCYAGKHSCSSKTGWFRATLTKSPGDVCSVTPYQERSSGRMKIDAR
jgi:hypothetical protein